MASRSCFLFFNNMDTSPRSHHRSHKEILWRFVAVPARKRAPNHDVSGFDWEGGRDFTW